MAAACSPLIWICRRGLWWLNSPQTVPASHTNVASSGDRTGSQSQSTEPKIFFWEFVSRKKREGFLETQWHATKEFARCSAAFQIWSFFLLPTSNTSAWLTLCHIRNIWNSYTRKERTQVTHAGTGHTISWKTLFPFHVVLTFAGTVEEKPTQPETLVHELKVWPRLLLQCLKLSYLQVDGKWKRLMELCSKKIC